MKMGFTAGHLRQWMLAMLLVSGAAVVARPEAPTLAGPAATAPTALATAVGPAAAALTASATAVGPAAAAAIAAVATASSAAADLSGVWQLSAGQGALRNADGGALPFLPWAAKADAERRANALAVPARARGLKACVPKGVPELMYGPEPFELLQAADTVLFIHQANHLPRFVYLNAVHPADLDPTYLGHSIGHWAGGALVIETIGFHEAVDADSPGMPHKESLRVVERLSLLEHGRVLQDEMTIEDPATFTRPWYR